MLPPDTPITPGWTLVHIGFDGDAVLLSGLDPWRLKWHDCDEPRIIVAHPAHPQQRHDMDVHELRAEGRVVRFAAGEFSNGVWGLYEPAGLPR